MLRNAIVRLGLSAGLLAIPAAIFLGYQGMQDAQAQGLPPDPPMVMYGDAPGASVGQGVHAFVQANGNWTWCGAGSVLEPAGPGYVVQVVSDTQTSGCGSDSRNIRLYFTPVSAGDPYDGSAGRLTTNTITWQADISVPQQQNVTLGPQLEVRGLVPGVAARVE